MPRLEIRPFSEEHLDAAARLLARRHERHRAAEHLLPERFEDPAAAVEEVKAAWAAQRACGSIGFHEGRPVGFLVGSRRDADVWGENIWVDYAGHGVETAEDVRDLYATAAGRWVEEGATNHYVLVPAFDDALVNSWFRLGFGQQQGHGVREVSAGTAVQLPAGLEIRKPTADDVDSLVRVDLALPKHHRTSPVFSTRPIPTEQESRDEWARTLAGNEEEVLIGCLDGKPVAAWSLDDGTRSSYFKGLARPEQSCYLGFAATLPEIRGSGVGVAMTDASFAWAAEAGYTSMGTDWRVTNLLASRFWPRRGFRVSFLRLYRHIP
jgi:ribosomal protein S18 acetylase RimI-like enzyme